MQTFMSILKNLSKSPRFVKSDCSQWMSQLLKGIIPLSKIKQLNYGSTAFF